MNGKYKLKNTYIPDQLEYPNPSSNPFWDAIESRPNNMTRFRQDLTRYIDTYGYNLSHQGYSVVASHFMGRSEKKPSGNSWPLDVKNTYTYIQTILTQLQLETKRQLKQAPVLGNDGQNVQ